MGDVWIKIAIGFLKGVSVVYDAVTYLPYCIIERPSQKREVSRKIKAVHIDPSDPTSPLRSVESLDKLTTTPFPGYDTLDELVARAMQMYASHPCLGARELLSEEDEVQPSGKVFKKSIYGDYHFLTFEEVNQRLSNFGSGLLALGQKPHKNICIFCETRMEWMIAALGCFKYNFPVVTLYSTLGDEAIIHGVNESDVSVVITSDQLLKKFKATISKMPKIEHIIYVGHGKPNVNGFPKRIQIHSMDSVEQMGARPENIRTPASKPSKEDLAVIMYTSGSTAMPKGVLISHANLVCGMSGQSARIPAIGPDDAYIGYLPLAHVLELSAELVSIVHGVRVGYSSPLTLSDQSGKIKKGSKGDASVLKPTLMASVPVVMDRLYKAVWEKVNEGGKFQKEFFTFAYEYKKKHFARGFDTPVLNWMIFRKIQLLLGGRLRMMLSGGAPLSKDTQRFMNICFGCPVGQGYGLTETCGAGTIHAVTDMSTGRVGAPLSCNDIKLLDWVEGGYKVTDKPVPRGEVLLGGGNVTMGYFKNPVKTREDFVEINGQRWFATGDIGEIHPDGCICIIDRKKDLVKLQAGEFVSLAKVETAIKMAPLFDMCCVHADSTKTYTVALVVPNLKQLTALGTKLGVDVSDWKALCKNQQIEKAVTKTVHEQAIKEGLERFEIPQRVSVCHDAWTPDSGLVTDAFKLRRRIIQSRYQSEIERMYA